MRQLLYTLATLLLLFTAMGTALIQTGCSHSEQDQELETLQSQEGQQGQKSSQSPVLSKSIPGNSNNGTVLRMMESPAARYAKPQVLRSPAMVDESTLPQPLVRNRLRTEAEADQIEHNTEQYDHIKENQFIAVNQDPLSTFSIDVDTASYANVRRMLNHGQLPPAGAVRIEEMVNYFEYDYAPPTDDRPFSVNTAVATAPWNKQHQLVRIGLKGKVPTETERGDSNLVFLIDTSGSMNSSNKLGLVKESLNKLVNELGEKDRVSIVTYASRPGVALMPTPASDRDSIRKVINGLGAGGSTNGAGGIQMAYQLAQDTFIKGGNNRVIICTDGDFNVGLTNRSELVSMIQENAKSGVFLTVLGFGMGNYKDGTLEQLANKGNGNYGYIDTAKEAEKMLVRQMTGTLITIAKDVKIQIEFNPSKVKAYRLIGYENRMLAHQDFNDDKKDAGEIGAGHTVTALYEIVPAEADTEVKKPVDELKYSTVLQPKGNSEDLLTLKLRYKAPDGDTSKLIETAVKQEVLPIDQAPADMQFAVAVAAFGMILRKSEFADEVSLEWVKEVAESTQGKDPGEFRAEFVELVGKTQKLRAQLAARN